jgi:hypothetical protein
MECLIVNFIDKIVQFLAQRLQGYTCNRNHFKRDAEDMLVFPSSLPFLSKNPFFKGGSKDSSLTSSLPYLSLHLSHHPSLGLFRTRSPHTLLQIMWNRVKVLVKT